MNAATVKVEITNNKTVVHLVEPVIHVISKPNQITTKVSGVVVGARGPKGDVGDDKYFQQAFNSESSVTVTHNLSKRPAVTVVDSSGDECVGDIIYNSDNQITVNFSAPFSGVIYCN